jgi:hypothetical protein
MSGSLFATSDLHVSYAENRKVVDRLRPESDDDWLIVAGDVGDLFGDIERTLSQLRERFSAVIWAPGNHELWTHPSDPVTLRGEERYRELVRMCRDNGVLSRRPTCCGIRSSRSGAAPTAPPTGTCGTGPPRPSTATRTYLAPHTTTACGSKRCHWAIRASGNGGAAARHRCAGSWGHDDRDSAAVVGGGGGGVHRRPRRATLPGRGRPHRQSGADAAQRVHHGPALCPGGTRPPRPPTSPAPARSSPRAAVAARHRRQHHPLHRLPRCRRRPHGRPARRRRGRSRATSWSTAPALTAARS